MIQLYTGEGKGKTTAATGLALRALGNGWQVLFVQFMKSVPSGEVTMLRRCGGEKVRVLREWDDSFILSRPSDKQIAMARRLWERMGKSVVEERPDLLVLDEIAVAIAYGLIEETIVLDFIKSHPKTPEIV